MIHRGGGSDLGANSHYYLTRNPFLVLRHVETGRRRAALRGAIYRGVSGTNLARQAGDREKWLAIAAGLRDGLRGRFGKRPADSPGPAFVALLGWWTLCASLRDKWRAARGLAPGYPPLERCLLGDLAGARSHRHD